jgi:hypothetical protein
VARNVRLTLVQVIDDDERHGSIAEAVLLGFRGELGHHVFSLGIVTLLVGDEIGDLDPAMGAHQPKREDAGIEQSDKEWARNVEHVRCLLGRELGVDGDDGDGIAVGHVTENLEEKLECLPRYGDRYRLVVALGTNLDGAMRLPSREPRKRAKSSLSLLGHLGGR